MKIPGWKKSKNEDAKMIREKPTASSSITIRLKESEKDIIKSAADSEYSTMSGWAKRTLLGAAEKASTKRERQ